MCVLWAVDVSIGVFFFVREKGKLWALFQHYVNDYFVFIYWFFEEAESNELPNSYSKYLLDEKEEKEDEEEEEEEKKNSFVFSCIHSIIYKVADGRYSLHADSTVCAHCPESINRYYFLHRKKKKVLWMTIEYSVLKDSTGCKHEDAVVIVIVIEL